MDNLTFDQLLEGRNVNGEVYRCDVKRYFGWDLPKEKIEEIYQTITRMKDENK